MFEHLRSEDGLAPITQLQKFLSFVQTICYCIGVFEIAIGCSKEMDHSIRYVAYNFSRKVKEIMSKNAVQVPRC